MAGVLGPPGRAAAAQLQLHQLAADRWRHLPDKGARRRRVAREGLQKVAALAWGVGGGGWGVVGGGGGGGWGWGVGGCVAICQNVKI